MKALVLVAVLAAEAHAFPTGTQFELDALASDGGGGIAFDGAPRFVGHTCAVCHTAAPLQIETRLESDHAEVFSDGWKPGQQYHMRVLLQDAHAGQQYQADGDNCGFAVMPYRPCDQNGFALEIDDLNGAPKGTFAPVVNNACATGMPPDVDIHIFADGTAITHNGAHHAQLAWDFCWTAPAAGTGLLTAYIAVVDGNGGDGTMAFPADTIGDDVSAGAVPIPELGGTKPMTQSGGCAVGGDAGIGLALVVLLGLLVRRRTVLAIVLAVASGCVHVRPHQREALARRNMKFAPDPTEDELDLHMQEAREGSSGGYGSSGGGCGCN